MAAVDAATRRKRFIDIALRRARPGSGSGPTTLKTRSSSYQGMNLREVFRHTPFVVVGGVATRRYMPERATLDIDVLVHVRDGARAAAELRAAGATWLQALSVGGASWRLPDGTALDVIESSAPWVDSALSELQEGPEGLPYVALPYLVLMKLQAGRAQDVADVSRMVALADEHALADVRRVIQRSLPDAVDDLESLLLLGRLELRGSTE